MLSPRSYRPRLTPEQACLELRQDAGKQFDQRVVEAFLTCLETAASTLAGPPHEPGDLALVSPLRNLRAE